jgi:hypothetical protein
VKKLGKYIEGGQKPEADVDLTNGTFYISFYQLIFQFHIIQWVLPTYKYQLVEEVSLP